MPESGGLRTLNFGAPPSKEPAVPTVAKEIQPVASTQSDISQQRERPLPLSERQFRLQTLGTIKTLAQEDTQDQTRLKSDLDKLYQQAYAETAAPIAAQDVKLPTTEGIDIPQRASYGPQLNIEDPAPKPQAPLNRLVFDKSGIMHEVPPEGAEQQVAPKNDPLPELHVEHIPTSDRESLPELHVEEEEPLPSLGVEGDSNSDAAVGTVPEISDELENHEESAPTKEPKEEDGESEVYHVPKGTLPFDTTDEEVCQKLGNKTIAEIADAEASLFASMFGEKTEDNEDTSFDSYEVPEGYNPFRAKKGKEALECLAKARELQRACDVVNSNTLLTTAASAMGSAWDASVGKVLRGSNPKDWLNNTGRIAAVKRYQKSQTLSEVRVLMGNDLRKAHTTMAKLSERTSKVRTFNNGTAACAVILLQSLSRKSGCIGVKVDRTEDAWEDNTSIGGVVELEDFGGVYILFDTRDNAQVFRKFIDRAFDTALIDIEATRRVHSRDRDESIESATILGDAVVGSTEQGLEEPVDTEHFSSEEPSVTVEEQAIPVEQVRARRTEENVRANSQQSTTRHEATQEGEGPIYVPFKEGMLEKAIQGLLDAKALQVYEDYKGTPHGIKGLIDSFRNDPADTRSQTAYGSSYNRGYQRSSYSPSYNNRAQQTTSRIGAMRQGMSMFTQRAKHALNRSKENRIMHCSDLDSLLEMQKRAMRKISPGLLRKLRSGASMAPTHVDGLATIFACKILIFTLSGQSGVHEVIMGAAENRQGYAVLMPDFDNLRCIFNDQNAASDFIEYMSEWFFCEPDTGRGGRYGGYSSQSYGSYSNGYGSRYNNCRY